MFYSMPNRYIVSPVSQWLLDFCATKFIEFLLSDVLTLALELK